MCQDAECCCLWGIAQWSSCPRVQRVLHSQSCRSLQAPLHRIGTYWTCTWKPRKSEKNAWGDMGAHIPTCSKQNLRDFLAMLGGDGFSWEQVWEKSTVSYTEWSKHRWGSHAEANLQSLHMSSKLPCLFTWSLMVILAHGWHIGFLTQHKTMAAVHHNYAVQSQCVFHLKTCSDPRCARPCCLIPIYKLYRSVYNI